MPNPFLPCRRGLKNRSAFVSDLHAPRHDPDAFEDLLDALEDYQPKHLFLLGDIWDCNEVSRHPKGIDSSSNLQASIDDGCERVNDIVKVSGAEHVVLMFGNHEAWWEKWLLNKAAEAASLRCLKMEELFRLKEIGITEVYRYGHVLRWNGLSLLHGRKARSGAGATGREMLKDHFSSGVSGHVHRLAKVSTSKSSGEYFWVENGCLCRMDPEFVEDGVPDWQHGFSVGFDDENGRHQVVPVPLRGSQNPKVHT